MVLRPAPRSLDNVGVYLGKVTRVNGSECYVEVPRLAPGYEYGPARYPAVNRAGRRTDLAPAADAEHRHTLTEDQLTAGDPVAVAFLEGGRDELVVLVRLA